MSKHQSLTVSERVFVGNQVVKLRREKKIPAVVYGYGLKKSLPLEVNYNDFEKVHRKAGSTTVVELMVNKKKIITLIHNLQYHPVKDTYQHIDFLAVNLKEEVEAVVPLIFTGTPRPVKEDGAVLVKALESVTVLCLPDKIPHEIEVDLTKIDNIDDMIKVSDIADLLPIEVKISDNLDTNVALVTFVQEESEEETPETIVGGGEKDEIKE